MLLLGYERLKAVAGKSSLVTSVLYLIVWLCVVKGVYDCLIVIEFGHWAFGLVNDRSKQHRSIGSIRSVSLFNSYKIAFRSIWHLALAFYGLA